MVVRFAPGLWLLAASLLVAIMGCPVVCRAQRLPKGKHCLGEERVKLLFDHTLAGSINPLGLENQFRLSLCVPLVRRDGVLYEFTNVEVGIANYISPTHVHLGGFINLTPLSFLVLRGELTGAFIWPLPLPGAGYIQIAPDPGTQNQYPKLTNDVLNPPPSGSCDPTTTVCPGTNTFALRGLLGVTLQGLLPLGKRLGLIVLDSFAGEYWRVGDAGGDHPFFYVARRDLILHGGGDWLITNTALLLLNVPIRENYVFRIGPTDDLQYVPASGYLANLVAGIVAFLVKDAGNRAHNLQFFARVGGYTHHGFRDGVALAAGIDVIYDFTPTRRGPSPLPPPEPAEN